MSSVTEWLRAHAGLTVSVGAFLFVVAIGQADGGYFPTSWGWSALAFAWIAAIALIATPRLSAGPLEFAFLGALLLFVGWVALSIAWSRDPDQTVLEIQRGLLYLIGAVATVLVLRRTYVAYLLGGLIAGITWISLLALDSRLLPGAGPDSEVLVLGRLSNPVSYFNTLGLFAVMGALLALGVVAHGRSLVLRAAAAATLPVLLTTAYFTFSRGAVLVFAVGLLASIALDRRRLSFLTTLVSVGLPSVAAVWIASRASGLTSMTASRELVADEGGRLAIILLALTAGSVAVALGVGAVGRRIEVPVVARRAYATAVGCLAVALVVVTVVALGGPANIVDKTRDSLNGTAAAPRGEATDLNAHLGSISSSGRVEQWRLARDDFREHPWAGTGAGSYEQYWLQHRPNNGQVRDAHSLYLETLAELGVPGLILLLTALAIPLVGALRARAHPLAAAAFGAYVAYLARAGIDWDWEMPVVTLVALVCGAALIAARSHDESRSRRWAIPRGWRALAVAAVLAIAVFSMVGQRGNRAIADAGRAMSVGNFRDGETGAETAVRWAPWSAEAHQLLGRAQAGLGKAAEGRATLRKATRMNADDWRIWYDLGLASGGAERQRAFARAAALNPLEDDIEQLRVQGFRLPTPPKQKGPA